MNIKNTILAFMLVSVIATEPVMAAVESKNKVEQAKSTFKTFKKDVRRIFTRKGFTHKRKIRLTKQGFGLLSVIAFWYGFRIVREPSASNRKKPIPATRTSEPKETKREDTWEDHFYREEVDSMITELTTARWELSCATQEDQSARDYTLRRYDEATKRFDEFEKTVRADWETSKNAYRDALNDQAPEKEREKAKQAFTKAARRQRIFLQKNIDSMQDRAQ